MRPPAERYSRQTSDTGGIGQHPVQDDYLIVVAPELRQGIKPAAGHIDQVPVLLELHLEEISEVLIVLD